MQILAGTKIRSFARRVLASPANNVGCLITLTRHLEALSRLRVCGEGPQRQVHEGDVLEGSCLGAVLDGMP